MDFHIASFFITSYKPHGGCYIPNVHLKSQGKFKIHWVNTVTYTKGPRAPSQGRADEWVWSGLVYNERFLLMRDKGFEYSLA